jgi:hypothetical protein
MPASTSESRRDNFADLFDLQQESVVTRQGFNDGHRPTAGEKTTDLLLQLERVEAI